MCFDAVFVMLALPYTSQYNALTSWTSILDLRKFATDLGLQFEFKSPSIVSFASTIGGSLAWKPCEADWSLATAMLATQMSPTVPSTAYVQVPCPHTLTAEIKQT